MHCPYEALADLEEVLAEVRTWDHIRETAPGVFYVKRTPFLHFHVNKEGDRWADARCGKDWGKKLVIARPAGAAARKSFLADVRRYFAETLAAVVKPSARR